MLSHLRRILNFNCLIILASLSLTGCTSLAIIGAGVGGAITSGYIMGRDKTMKQSTDDSVIEAQIKRNLSNKFPGIFTNITIASNNGCVLLAGNVKEENYIKEAEKIAWTIKGVNRIDNHLNCGNEISSSQELKDGYITSTCKTKLVATKNVKSRNIKVITVNSVVYLYGTAHSNDELEDILSVVKNIRSIKKVVSYITIQEVVTRKPN